MTGTARPHILLVGCGKMGAALLSGWLRADIVSRVTVLEPNPLSLEDARLTHIHSAGDITPCDMIVLAIKPQILDDVCATIKSHIDTATPVLSIAAGKTLATLAAAFHAGQPVIRAMPNLPAAVGKGAAAACANKPGETYRQRAEALLRPVGDCVWLDDESLLDAVTAVSGSGPAYIFYLIEALSKAGMKAGLPADIAARLARQTVIGAGALADAQGHIPAATLRENVTSKGGTTEAALNVLMDGRFQAILDDAVAQAAARAKELSR